MTGGLKFGDDVDTIFESFSLIFTVFFFGVRTVGGSKTFQITFDTESLVVAVSYTHLDVYKRQQHHSGDAGSVLESASGDLGGVDNTELDHIAVPVSYTHLDVYKRQAKSYPAFWEDYRHLGGHVIEEEGR